MDTNEHDCEGTRPSPLAGASVFVRRGLLRVARPAALWLVCATAPVYSRAATQEWPTGWPEDVGMDSSALVEMFDFVRKHEVPVHSVQIVRHGRLVLDAYFHPFNAAWRHDVASVTKSITSTLIGLAIDQGLLNGVKAPLTNLFPARPMARLDARKQRMTLEDLLTMRAGWDCGFEPKEARLSEMRRSTDWIQFMLDLPMVAEPGERFAYCSGNCHLLSALLSRAASTNALAFAQRYLFAPLDIRDVDWIVDSHGHNHGWGDLQLRPLDMAKLGQLFLQNGKWRGRQLLPDSWIASATRPHVMQTVNDDHYGYFWWVKGQKYAGVYEAVGRGGQRIIVWPAKDLVLVFTGGGFEPGDLANFVVKSLRSDQPLPPAEKAQANLKDRLAVAARPPAPQPVPILPKTAMRVSGRSYTLNDNSMGLAALALRFNQSTQTLAELTWLGQKVSCPVGLDEVERFSTNSLVNLPVAAKGRWLTEDQFLLQLDLVGRINCYRFKLNFTGELIRVSLSERTGLNDENFEGITKL